jgi:hypothetical protein
MRDIIIRHFSHPALYVIFIDMPGFTREDFEDVYSTAQMAHMGQKRRSGAEYFTHPSEVRNIVRRYYPDDYAAQMVALLHDSLEDAPGATVSSIEEMESFIRGSIGDPAAGEEVINAVQTLTHESGSDYGAYMISLLGEPLALRVKLADMLHNLSTAPTDSQKAKYKDAIAQVTQASGGIPTGVALTHWKELTALTESAEMRTLRSVIREQLRGTNMKARKGSTVRCPITDRIGIVLEKVRGAVTTYVRVLWETKETTLTEVVDVEVLSEPSSVASPTAGT